MIILNYKWGGDSLLTERRQGTGLVVLSPLTPSKGGQRQYKGGDSRG